MIRASLMFWLAGVSVLPTEASKGAKQGQLIVIDSADFQPFPIAVAETKVVAGAADTAETITKTLRGDFDLSYVFKLLDPKSYLANPAKEGITSTSIKFSDWLSVGADGLVKAQLNESKGQIRVEMRYFDVASGRERLKKSYSGTKAQARRFAHEFANEVVLLLTGQKGIFTTKIAAVKKTKTGRELLLFGLDGETRSNVTKNGSINLLPAWARNGHELIFTSYIKHNPNLYSIPVSGGRPKLLSGERGLNTGGAMSPDGRKIALTLSRDGNSEIYVMNSDGTGLRRLTNEWAIDSSPSWSPDSKRIAFVSSRWGDPHIFVMNADGSDVKRLTERGTYNQTPDWCPRPDLPLVAFTARDERNVFDIFTVNAETKEIKRLTQDQGNNEEPSFSPDGNLIAFTSTREGKSQVWTMAWNGSNQRRLTAEGGYSTPAWSPYLD